VVVWPVSDGWRHGPPDMSDQPRLLPATPARPIPVAGWARAYRAGRLVCARVRVTVGDDDRLGLTRRERRYVSARFLERLDRALWIELMGLVRRRGAAACRMAERLDPIELVVDQPDGEIRRIVGRLQPPQLRHGRLRDVEFGVRELEPNR
jgi:hypothetical protein